MRWVALDVRRDLSHLFREDHAIPRLDVGRVDTVCVAITIEGLLAGTHAPSRTCEGNLSAFIGGDKPKWILPLLLRKFIPPLWIAFQMGHDYAQL